MKFIGHLDMVRYFQKVMRRANVDICYSEGFSPHQKMSFAAPLSVGVISKGEYFDIEVNSSLSSKEMIKNINAQNVEGAKNAMSIVAGADYFVYTDLFTEEQVNDFYAQDEINILKKTKKSEKIVDIKPMIHEMKFNEDGIFMKVSQGSAANLKPDLVMSALEQFTGAKLPEFVQYERLDMYCLENDKLVSLSEIGGNIE